MSSFSGLPSSRELQQPQQEEETIVDDTTADIHDSAAVEFDADDSDGDQGGQNYVSPSYSPSSSAPTSNGPTRDTYVLTGVVWYDRNANGRRDAYVPSGGGGDGGDGAGGGAGGEDGGEGGYGTTMGDDVEYSHGVGGATVQLVECDETTGRAKSGNADSYASAMTRGVDASGRPLIVDIDDDGGGGGGGGKFDIHLVGGVNLDRYYLLDVRAPVGFLLTAGVCNDEVRGWECDYGWISSSVVVGNGEDGGGGGDDGGAQRRRRREQRRLATQGDEGADDGGGTEDGGTGGGGEVFAVGIESGRSTSCVHVDGRGRVGATMNFGVMRAGDARRVRTDVALVLDFDDAGGGGGAAGARGRRGLFEDLVSRATRVGDGDGAEGTDGDYVTTRYLLGRGDREAIGMVTAEVLAATLDVRLAANGVDLDSVVPLEVMLSSRRRYHGRDRRGLSSSEEEEEEEEEGASVVPGGQLAVSMEVMGHYSPPPDIDFDYVVRDSINRDTETIRRGLSEYNVHCREQTSKVLEQGLVRDDFDSVVSASGARPNGYRDGLPADAGGGGAGGGSFSTACSSSILVPEYFETNLREIEARGVSGVRFAAPASSAAATSSGLEAWAQGPVAAITGLIVLLAGVLLFRRSFGPRPAEGGGGKEGRDDKFRAKEFGGRVEKSRRFLFGEAGGDDESVDSAFYSDDDAAPKKTEKEGKARRKSRRATISSSATSHPATSLVASARGSLRSKSVRVGGGGYSAPSSSGAKAKSMRDVRGKSSRDLRGKSEPSKDHPRDKSTKKLSVSQGTDDSNPADGRSGSSDEARRASAREGKRSTAKRAQSMRTVSSKPSTQVRTRRTACRSDASTEEATAIPDMTRQEEEDGRTDAWMGE